MTRYDAVTIAELVGAWAKTLTDEIERLDSELPVEHDTEVRYRSKTQPAIEGLSQFLKPPDKHPELYDEYTVELPLSVLDGLRSLTEQMQDYCYRLVGKEDEP